MRNTFVPRHPDRARRRVGLTLLGLALGWGGCEPQADDTVVARVGSTEINLDALRQFRDDATADYRRPREDLEGWRYYRQTMIDMELMLLEAEELNLDQTPAFRVSWEKQRRQKLVNEFTSRTIIEQLDLALDDMRQRFADSKWNRVLRFSHIRTENLADAQLAMRDLDQGRLFEEVMAERAVFPPMAPADGVLDPWFGRGNLEELGLSLEIGEALFDLQIGDYSQPFAVDDAYMIFRVLEEDEAPAHYRAAYVRGEYWIEFRQRWDDLVAELKERMNPQIDGDVVRVLVERMSHVGRSGLILEDRDQRVILCRFEGGQITIRDFAESYNAFWFLKSVSFDSTGITRFIEQDMLPRTLVYHVALRDGLDQKPEVVEWLTTKKNSMMLEALRQNQVVEAVRLDSVMVREYFDANRSRFMEQESLQVAEILVATREEAERLLQEVRDGGDIGALAARHSLRQEAEDGHLHMRNHPAERRVYGFLYDAVAAAPVGVLNGPLELDEGYSVFQVLERTPARQAPFERAASRARWWVQKREEKKLFEALFSRLRDKYADEVSLFEEPLRRLATN